MIKKCLSKKNENIYTNLAPTSDAENVEVYTKPLECAIQDPDIKNIAISGTYGSGKSSIIKTFFTKNINFMYKPIYISLGIYNKKDIINDDLEQSKQNELVQSIEKGILQQMLYQTNGKKMSLSRFNRIKKTTPIVDGVVSIIIVFAIFSTLFFINPDIFSIFKERVKILNEDFSYFVIYSSLIVCLGLLMISIYKFIALLKYRFVISKLKYKDTEIEINDKSESIFNRFLDEIIYFFRENDYTVVVIEDLDRFERISSNIFQKLRELNQIINSSKEIKRKITFIYAIRDDFFKDQEDRTKFFEFIIPTIPVASYYNSKEYIKNLLDEYKKKLKIDYNIDEDYIKDISEYIDNMRLINNTITEFYIYKEKLKNIELDDKKLLSIIVYKNLDPSGYADLLNKRGVIYSIFEKKNKFIENIVLDINKQIESLEYNIEKVNENYLNSIFELKSVLITSLINFSNSNSERFKINNDYIGISDFLKEEYDTEWFVKNKITYNVMYRNDHTEEQTFKHFKGKENFVLLYKTLKDGKENSLKNYKSSIENCNNDIQVIQEKTISELINHYNIDVFNCGTDVEELSIQIKQLISFLLKRGYIDETYHIYISNFVEGGLKYSDLNFISSVKRGITLKYDYNIENIKNVIDELSERDFDEEGILNFSILKYVLNNNNKKDNKVERLFINLRNINKNKFEFFNNYIDFQNSNNNVLLKKILENNNDLWDFIIKNYKEDKNMHYKWIKLLFLYNKNITKINNYEQLKEIVESVEDFESIFKDLSFEEEKMIFEILIKDEYKFNRLKNVDDKIIDLVYTNNLYELNTHMITFIMVKKGIDVKNFKTMGFTLIMSSPMLMEMKSYIANNYNNYLNKSFFLNESTTDDEKFIRDILKTKEISNDYKLRIVEKEKIVFNDVNEFGLEICDYIFKNNKVIPNWENIKYYYEILDNNINNIIWEFINNNTNDLLYETLFDLNVYGNLFRTILYFNDVNEKIIKYIYNNVDDINSLNLNVDNLSPISLKVLIDSNSISFNKDNYNYILSQKNELHFVKYINNNLDEFLNSIMDLDFNIEQLELLFSSPIIDSDKKLRLFEKVDKDIIHYKFIESLYNQVLYPNIIKISKEKKSLIFNSNISNISKVKLLIKIINELGFISDEEIEYLKQIDEKFIEVFEYCGGQISIDKNDENNQLLSILKEKGHIKNYVVKSQVIVIYILKK